MRNLLMIIVMSVAAHLGAAAIHRCPEWLEPAVEAIEEIPEAQGLLDQVECEGGVTLTLRSASGFAAYWRGSSRTIVINASYRRSQASIIRSIVFELCNAATNRQLNALWRQASRGQISSEAFVRAVERLEFQNLQRAARILDAGIERQLIPYTARGWSPTDFESFLQNEEATGHTTFLRRRWEAARN